MSAAPGYLPLPGQSCLVFAAEDIFVSIGVNNGEGLGLPDTVVLGDIYELDEGAEAERLVLNRNDEGQTVIAPGSSIGTVGDVLHTLGRHTMMSPDGDKLELVMLALGQRHFALPLSPMRSRTDYTLLATEASADEAPLADLMCLSFARGTMISLATGRQVPIEDLEPGNMILTRDHGAQPLRLVGRATLRAVGSFAPVVITAGTLGNSGDLVVSQHHRMFLYQRQRLAGLATSELLVQARHLVDEERVFIREGGFVDWFSLIFDHHEIIYAEGIPAESLMVNEATVSRLVPEIAAEVRARLPGLTQTQHFGTEAGRQVMERIGTRSLFQPPRRLVGRRRR